MRMNRRRKAAPKPVHVETLIADSLGARGDAVMAGPVFTPGLLPGEGAKVEVQGQRGRVLERISTSPDRVEPFCPVAERCGGCSLQHFEESAYRLWKRHLVVDALEKAGVHAEVRMLVDAHGEGRRRMTLHAQRFGAKLVVGFAERAGDKIVDITDCPVSTPGLRASVPGLRKLAEVATPKKGRIDIHVLDCEPGLDVSIQGVKEISLALREAGAELAGKYNWTRVTIGGDPLIEFEAPVVKFGDTNVTPAPGGFLQATAEGEAVLASFVDEAVKSLEGKGPFKAADLFAGAGAFALRLARTMPVLAVEGESGLLHALQRAAQRTPGLKPVDARVRDLALEPITSKELEGYSLVVIDPPRAGAKAQAERLSDSLVPVIVSISCNPATFARDAAILIEGGYRMGPVTPVDQFKWTGHVESVAVFRRR